MNGLKRKKWLAAALACAVTVSLAPAAFAEDAVYNLDLSEAIEDGDYSWAYNETYDCYELTDVCYCATPVNHDYETLHIYVPAVYVKEDATLSDGSLNIDYAAKAGPDGQYVARTAPVLICNAASGWAGQMAKTLDGFGRTLELDFAGCLESGFVIVSIGTRGPATTDADGNYDGKAPQNVADAKAAIRFVRANLDCYPGDTDCFISVGTSGGGGMSAVIGASGDSDDYDPYLEEIGAVMDVSDAVYGDMCYCPITDLDHADLAYEWTYQVESGDTVRSTVITDFTAQVNQDLAAGYKDYIVSLDIGYTEENFDSDFGGDIALMMEESLNTFLDVTEFPYTVQSGGFQTPVTETTYNTPEEYIAAQNETVNWLSYDSATNTATIVGDTPAEKWQNFLASGHNTRSKQVPGFDVFDASSDSRAESHLFGDATTDAAHYSRSVAEILLSNAATYAGLDGYSDYYDNDPAFLTSYYTALSDSMQERVDALNPITYLEQYREDPDSVTPAQHFRLLVGSTDSNTTPAVVFTLGKTAEAAGIDTEYGYIWGQGHGTREYNKQDFIDWVNEIADPSLPFTDVQDPDSYYFEPVYWAADRGIAAGTSSDTFSPSDACTRAQFVTFLWRAAGEPDAETDTCPFTDVKSDSYYYEAVLWAYEKGIVSGTSSTTFSPNEQVTRAQAVSFLYRYEGEPAVTSDSGFADVPADAYYADPVAWAVTQNITAGLDATHFGPYGNCTRGMTVTFLYNDLAV